MSRVVRAKATANTFKVAHDPENVDPSMEKKVRPRVPTRRAALGDVTNQRGFGQAKLEKGHHSKHTVTKIPRKSVTVYSEKEIVSQPVPVFDESVASYNISCLDNDVLHDIDSPDLAEPTLVAEYAEEIHRYYFSVEANGCADPSYMQGQKDVNSKMRAILVDWLIDVHTKYRLEPQTLYIAVNLIDRYLQEKQVRRQKLQLVGVTAMFMASKYEEIYPPEAHDFIRITDNAYSIDEIFDMEQRMLQTLSYRVTVPTSYQFLRRILKAANSMDDRADPFAQFVIERSLQEFDMLKYLPSTIAASAVYLSREVMQESPTWHSTLQYHSSYSEDQLGQCVADLKRMLAPDASANNTNQLSAALRKFSHDKYLKVGRLQIHS